MEAKPPPYPAAVRNIKLTVSTKPGQAKRLAGITHNHALYKTPQPKG